MKILWPKYKSILWEIVLVSLELILRVPSWVSQRKCEDKLEKFFSCTILKMTAVVSIAIWIFMNRCGLAFMFQLLNVWVYSFGIKIAFLRIQCHQLQNHCTFKEKVDSSSVPTKFIILKTLCRLQYIFKDCCIFDMLKNGFSCSF